MTGKIVLVLSLLVLVCLTRAVAHGWAEPQAAATGPTLTDNPERGFFVAVNPLGFLQFGPAVELDLRLVPNLYILGVFRYHSAGILSYTITPDLQANGVAFGAGLRYFFRSPSSPHAWFLGSQFQYGTGGTAGNQGTASEYTGRFSYVVGAAETGYCWRFGRLSVMGGILCGVEHTLDSTWSYVSSPSVTHKSADYASDIVFCMFETNIGCEF